MSEPSKFPQTLPTNLPGRPGLRRPGENAHGAGLYFQRTVIPVMLVLGAILAALGAAQWTAPADQAYSSENLRWSAIALPVLGLQLLVLAALNMISVWRKLRR